MGQFWTPIQAIGGSLLHAGLQLLQFVALLTQVRYALSDLDIAIVRFNDSIKAMS